MLSDGVGFRPGAESTGYKRTQHARPSLGAGSVRNIYDTLARVFSAAVNDRVIALTPCRNIQLPRMDDGEVTPPTVEEVTRVIAAIPDRYRAAAILLAGSGLMIGELLGLQVADVKFLERTVRVERQRLQSGKIAKAKTSKSVRTVRLAQLVVDALAAHLATYHPSNDALFADEHGNPLTYPAWQHLESVPCKGPVRHECARLPPLLCQRPHCWRGFGQGRPDGPWPPECGRDP